MESRWGFPWDPFRLADIFVGHCESSIPEDHWPCLYDRFVDDTFALFNNQERSQQFSEVLNNLHPALAFTLESENDGRLPFMDVLIERKDGDLRRSIYRKPTFTGLDTRWDSFSPTSNKISLNKSLTSRAHKICSPSMLDLEISKLKSIFADNGFPSLVVDRVIRQTLERRSGDSKGNAEKSTSPSVTICLLWIGHSSTTLGKEIREAITGLPKSHSQDDLHNQQGVLRTGQGCFTNALEKQCCL